MKEQIIKLLDGPVGKIIGMDKLWDAIEKYIAAEVERRIAERMPSEDQSNRENTLTMISYFNGNDKQRQADMMWGWIKCDDWLRSHLAKNNSAELSQIKQINATENKQEGEGNADKA